MSQLIATNKEEYDKRVAVLKGLRETAEGEWNRLKGGPASRDQLAAVQVYLRRLSM